MAREITDGGREVGEEETTVDKNAAGRCADVLVKAVREVAMKKPIILGGSTCVMFHPRRHTPGGLLGGNGGRGRET